ncbi:MAG TPA: protease pro-enzyme activation domain-containing protein [Acidimicrobiales bacterium]|nr:protease pro-enzyme activation domain-containing protein [Acidimicrobiales bacterium]
MKTRTWGTALFAGIVSLGALIPLVGAGVTDAAGANGQSRYSLPGGAPHVPADVTKLGAVPGGRMLHLSVALAGQDPSGLTAEVAAVSDPTSPQYRHFLSSSQFDATYGPSAAEQQQVASALRAEGLTVGTAAPGSTLLPVSGSATTVGAAFGTGLESIELPSHDTTLVNTAAPQLPSSLQGEVTAVIGLDGLAQQHSQLLQAPHSTPTPNEQTAHSSGPQACGASSTEAGGSSYTSTQLANDYGLNQLFSQGRTGIGQTIGIVEFEQYSANDIAVFQSCYGLNNSVKSEVVDGPVNGRASGSGESALDIELAAVNAPSASIIVYEAPNEASDAASIDLLNRIATDDLAQTVTTSWGICERDNAAGDDTEEASIFARMAVQGQTMISASGDSGSEDCFETDGGTEVAADDPGTQPDVISVGGTSLANGNVTSQSVWNNCAGQPLGHCQNSPGDGAGGGGYSAIFSRPAWQPAPSNGAGSTVCGDSGGCRSVPDFSGSADPDHGVTAYFASAGGWTIFGGTSAVAPSTAGLFADTDQGCTATLGMVGPALYAAANGSTFTDVTTGTNDFTDSEGGAFTAVPGFDAASGLGTPIDQNLAIALQGSEGCPSVATLNTSGGPLSNALPITVSGGGLANATTVSFGSAGVGRIISQTETSLVVAPPAVSSPVCVDVTVTNPRGISAASIADRYGFGGSINCGGYRFVASDGGIFDFGSPAFQGSTGALSLKAPIVGMATTPSGNGYWLVASDGGIFTFGDARFYGSAGALPLKAPIVGMAATPNGNGYWLVASDGGIFTYGAARFLGSTGALALTKPIIAMASTPDGGGYWLVASDGGIFTFGDARFFGSAGATRLAAPIVGMAATADGNGYWLVASDGGIFSYGDAAYHGSTGGTRLNRPIVGIARTITGNGYWLVASDGGIFSFGDAQFYGSTGAIRLNRPIVGMSTG